MSTKTFSTGALMSISTGRLLCKFSEMHELAEWLMGHPIWTHEFASSRLSEDMRREVLAQFPWLPLAEDAKDVNADNWEEYRSRFEVEHGTSHVVTEGNHERLKNPLETLREMAPDKPIIAVVPESRP